jgi:OOP family OmpA-OmpF porin
MAMFVMPDDSKTYRVVIDREMLMGAVADDDQPYSFDNIYFDFNSDKIRSEAALVLNKLAAVLKENADKKIIIKAHTDALGTDEVNKTLAERRGESVRNYLVSKGVSGNRIEVVAIGDDQPVASNDIDMGRQLNRRVEFEIMN